MNRSEKIFLQQQTWQITLVLVNIFSEVSSSQMFQQFGQLSPWMLAEQCSTNWNIDNMVTFGTDKKAVI